jgi:hypothetical protein
VSLALEEQIGTASGEGRAAIAGPRTPCNALGRSL